MFLSNRNLWIILFTPPFLFFFFIFIYSVLLSIGGINPATIPDIISSNISVLLFFVQICLSVLIFIIFRNNFSIIKNSLKTLEYKKDFFIGIAFGVFLAVLYIILLMPFQNFLQFKIGDYIPVGSTTEFFKNNLFLFFLANVVLAPIVEEVLYRSVILNNLVQRIGKYKAVIISSFFFGLLHWVGGFWYILMTMLFIGIPFSLIAINKKNIFLVFIAHLTLNFLEFVFIFFVK
jgi:membrane protease YdiL (CAAX protease family)